MSPLQRATARKQRREGRRRGKTHEPLLQLVTTEPARRPKRSPAPLKFLTEAQRQYSQAIRTNRITFGIGPAGTGKTWLAAALAAEQLSAGKIQSIVVTRPAIEAGENLGFMPGDLEEKYQPYFRPVRDALEERLGAGPLEYYLKAGIIEARPLAFLRGATLSNAWVIADEMQNATPAQMKLFLTRIGENSTFIVNGDISQQDIEGKSGLEDAIRRLDGLPGLRIVRFTMDDIVRDGMCQLVAMRYDESNS
jgi:phosphate starvation-inducible PhoH-like protein